MTYKFYIKKIIQRKIKPFAKVNLTILMCAFLLLGNLGYLNAIPQQIKTKKIEAENLRNEIDRINTNLSIAVENYNEARDKLIKINTKIRIADIEIEGLKEKLVKNQGLLGKRVKAIYRYGGVAIIEVILDSRNFTDFLNRVHYLVLITKRDSEIIDDIKKAKNALTEKMNVYKVEKSRQVSQSIELENNKNKVKMALAYKKQIYKNKMTEIAALEEEERRIEAKAIEEAKKRQELLAKQSSQNKSNPGEPSVAPAAANSARANKVVAIAMKYQGVRYVWGGSTPQSGFDCSGFTAYVYAKVGIRLPHSSRAQFRIGKAVPRRNLQPGDLVFFGSPVHHVSMYIGNDSMIDAPQSGDHVRIRSFSRHRSYVGARRYL